MREAGARAPLACVEKREAGAAPGVGEALRFVSEPCPLCEPVSVSVCQRVSVSVSIGVRTRRADRLKKNKETEGAGEKRGKRGKKKRTFWL